MTTEVLAQSVCTYREILEKTVELGGSQIMFVDDSPEMLQYIQLQLKLKYNLMHGYIIEPNPILAHHVTHFIISQGIQLNKYIKCAVLDIDFGIYNKSISVNTLIKLFLDNNVPVILFSGLSEWKEEVHAEYHERVKYIYKCAKDSIQQLYSAITENSNYEVIQK